MAEAIAAPLAVIDEGSEGWRERAASSKRDHGEALIRDVASGRVRSEPLDDVAVHAGARDCEYCHGSGRMDRVHGELVMGLRVWRATTCNCTRRRAAAVAARARRRDEARALLAGPGRARR